MGGHWELNATFLVRKQNINEGDNIDEQIE